jgi:hypothetical protein
VFERFKSRCDESEMYCHIARFKIVKSWPQFCYTEYASLRNRWVGHRHIRRRIRSVTPVSETGTASHRSLGSAATNKLIPRISGGLVSGAKGKNLGLRVFTRGLSSIICAANVGQFVANAVGDDVNVKSLLLVGCDDRVVGLEGELIRGPAIAATLEGDSRVACTEVTGTSSTSSGNIVIDRGFGGSCGGSDSGISSSGDRDGCVGFDGGSIGSDGNSDSFCGCGSTTLLSDNWMHGQLSSSCLNDKKLTSLAGSNNCSSINIVVGTSATAITRSLALAAVVALPVAIAIALAVTHAHAHSIG